MAENNDTGKGTQVQSLTRAFGLLQHLANAQRGSTTLGELAASASLAPSTAHRLLNSMRSIGFVDLDEVTGEWSVGLEAFTVGTAYLNRRDFIAEARPVLKTLVQETGETANLAVLHDGRHVFVAQVECQQVMRMVAQLGKPGSVHASGVGKALLSELPLGDVESVIARYGLARLTPKTLTEPAAFFAELERVRRTGYAVDDEEQLLGMRCVAANVFDEMGAAVAAVSISGPSVRLESKRLADVALSVCAAAADITQKIGGVTPSS